MKVDFAALFEQLVGAYARLPLAQKIAIPLLFVGSAALIVFVSRWANNPEYVAMYSGLEEADSASIVEALKDRKVNFRLRDEGRTIDISPPSMVDELRLEMASAGIPKGGTAGFELFDSTSLGQSSFMEKVKYVRAVQGELERTITSIDAVRGVRVHITLPDKSVFVKRDVLPTASVLLRLKAGAELDPKQVKGIAHLVASSVERLTPENVTIMDTKGTVLTDHQEKSDTNGADNTRLEYQRSMEAAYVKRIESMLSEVLGPGKVVARVSAELDFNKYEKEEEEYDPAGQVARSERSMEEGSGGQAQGGVPGVLSNLTNQPSTIAPPDSSSNNNVRREHVKNYELSRAVSHTVTAAGKLQRLTVAVLVDGEHVAGAADAQSGYQPLTPEKLAKIEQVVKQAVGFDAARGDVVTVENMQFFEPDASWEKAIDDGSTMELVYWAVPWALSVIFVIFLFLFVVNPTMKFLLKPTEAEADLSRLLPSGVQELEAELEVERQKMGLTPEVAQPAVDIEELEELLAQNHRLVKDNPQQAALLIRYWLNEGRL